MKAVSECFILRMQVGFGESQENTALGFFLQIKCTVVTSKKVAFCFLNNGSTHSS